MCAPTWVKSLSLCYSILTPSFYQHYQDAMFFLFFLILPGHLCVVLEKKAVLQQQANLLLTALLGTFVSVFCCSATSFGFFLAYFIACPADHVGMQISSAEKDSHEGCHTRSKDSFLFSICSLRSWLWRSPMSLRSLQPYTTKSGRLHIAFRFLYLNCWVCRSKIQDPTVQIPSHLPISPPTDKLLIIYSRGKQKSHFTSVQIVFYYKQEDRMEKSQTISSKELGDHEQLKSW